MTPRFRVQGLGFRVWGLGFRLVIHHILYRYSSGRRGAGVDSGHTRTGCGVQCDSPERRRHEVWLLRVGTC